MATDPHPSPGGVRRGFTTFLKASATDGIHFAKDAGGTGDTYCDTVVRDPYTGEETCIHETWIVNKPDGTPPTQDDIFRTLSFGAQSYLGAIGAEDSPVAGFDTSQDMQPLFGVTSRIEANMHIYHSGQFRSFLAKRRAFWRQFILDLNIPYNQPR